MTAADWGVLILSVGSVAHSWAIYRTNRTLTKLAERWIR
jgi:hypothetical protein